MGTFKDLINRVSQAEVKKQELYRTLFDRYYRSVFYFFIRRGFDTEECRDLAQETFLNVYKGLDSYKKQAGFETWILAIARNLWFNRRRRAGAQKRFGVELSLDVGDEDALPNSLPTPIVLSSSRSPEEECIDSERREQLRAALEQLPPQARRCQLLQLEGLKYREIADILGISIQAVRSHLFQARQRLEQVLKEPAKTAGKLK